MGGASGEIRGESKIEVYLKYKEETEGFGEMFQDCNPDPKHKKLCKKKMFRDPESGEWVLYYYLHT